MNKKILVIVFFTAMFLGAILAGCKVKESPNTRKLRLMNEAELEQILSQATSDARDCEKLSDEYSGEGVSIGFVDTKYGSAWENPYPPEAVTDSLFSVLAYTEYTVVSANHDGWYEDGYVLINNPLSTTPGWTYIGEGMCFVKARE